MAVDHEKEPWERLYQAAVEMFGDDRLAGSMDETVEELQSAIAAVESLRAPPGEQAEKPPAQIFLEDLAQHYNQRLVGALAVVYLSDGQTLVCRSGGMSVRDEVYGARMCVTVVEDWAFSPMKKRDARNRRLN
jgi:hypothetical protein